MKRAWGPRGREGAGWVGEKVNAQTPSPISDPHTNVRQHPSCRCRNGTHPCTSLVSPAETAWGGIMWMPRRVHKAHTRTPHRTTDSLVRCSGGEGTNDSPWHRVTRGEAWCAQEKQTTSADWARVSRREAGGHKPHTTAHRGRVRRLTSMLPGPTYFTMVGGQPLLLRGVLAPAQPLPPARRTATGTAPELCTVLCGGPRGAAGSLFPRRPRGWRRVPHS